MEIDIKTEEYIEGYICKKTRRKINADINATPKIARKPGHRIKIARKIESYMATHNGVKPLNLHQRANTRTPAIETRPSRAGRGSLSYTSKRPIHHRSVYYMARDAGEGLREAIQVHSTQQGLQRRSSRSVQHTHNPVSLDEKDRGDVPKIRCGAKPLQRRCSSDPSALEVGDGVGCLLKIWKVPEIQGSKLGHE